MFQESRTERTFMNNLNELSRNAISTRQLVPSELGKKKMSQSLVLILLIKISTLSFFVSWMYIFTFNYFPGNQFINGIIYGLGSLTATLLSGPI